MKKVLVLLGLTLHMHSCVTDTGTGNYADQQMEEKLETNFLNDSLYYSKFEKFTVSKISETNDETRNTLEYESLLEIVNDGKEDIKKKMPSQEDANQTMKWLKSSRGGHLTFNLEGITSDMANTGNYRVVIVDTNDEEIYREDLSRDHGNYSSGRYPYWNIAIVSPEKILEFPVKVYLINLITGNRDEFSIDAEMK